jgi:hypothetical protein
MRARRSRQLGIALIACWLALETAALWTPRILNETNSAEVMTRQTARVAVLFWGVAAAALLLNRRTDAKWIWTLACAAYLVHVATAFDRVHHWSHAAAFDHVQQVGGFGVGIFVSYTFSLLWIADVAWWWLGPSSYDSRSRWLEGGIHAFMAFVVFNGTVVYESGFIRWTAVLMFISLGILAWLQLVRRDSIQRIEVTP